MGEVSAQPTEGGVRRRGTNPPTGAFAPPPPQGEERDYAIVVTSPPSTFSEAPLVAADSGLAT